MKEFFMLGNYFDHKFHLPKKTGRNSYDGVLTHYCPAQTSLKLWEFPFYFGDINSICDSSVLAFSKWKMLSVSQRCFYLEKVLNVLETKLEEFARSLSCESGRPLWTTQKEVKESLHDLKELLRYVPEKIKSNEVDVQQTNYSAEIFFAPIGPCLVFGPLENPLYYSLEMIFHLFIGGNTVIYRPNEKTIHTAQLMAQIFNEVNIPSGVFSMVLGDKTVFRPLLSLKSIRGIFYLGHREQAKELIKIVGNDLSKMVYLGLSSKNASIILPDAPMNLAIRDMLESCFYASGQTGHSTSIILVHEDIQEEFIKKFHDLAKKIIIDHPFEYENEPFMGPLLDEKSLEHYLTLMGIAKREGAEEIMRGKKLQRKNDGLYVAPSIHFNREPELKGHYFLEEIWGPNAYFIPYKDLSWAIKVVNSLRSGLVSSVYSLNREFIDECKSHLEVGHIHVNCSTLKMTSLLPRSGQRGAGNYRLGGSGFTSTCNLRKATLELKNPQEDHFKSLIGLKI